MTLVLALKLFLVPSLIYLVTLAGRRWGPAIAGWLSAFPVVAGPILLTITLEQGAGFAAQAAQGTLLAVIATVTFCVTYAWASGRFGVGGSVACALAAYGMAVAVLSQVNPPVLISFAAVAACLLVAPRLLPSVPAPAKGGKPVNDVTWRMLSGAVLVLVVTLSASRLGPHLSGIFAMFPVMGTVLTTFSHARQGRAAAVALLRGMVLGFYAFAVFCLTVSLILPSNSIGLAFAIGFACALIVQLGLKAILTMRANQLVVQAKG
jgi:uncharacterized membrane protein (GlpM family)